MLRGRLLIALCAATGAPLGCDGEDALELSVDLRTDLVAAEEVATVRVELLRDGSGTALTQERDLGAGDRLADGRRVADFGGLAAGTLSLRMRLLGRSGEVVATRTARVTLRASSAVTVLVTRACAGVTCPAPDRPEATECLGGRCAPPECTPEHPETCPPPQCAADADCLGAAIVCLAARCVGGTCLLAGDDARCATDEYCHPDLGCQPRTTPRDAGTRDVGLDASAADGGSDAGADGGARDAAPLDLDGGGTRASPTSFVSPASFTGTTCGLPAECDTCSPPAPAAVFRWVRDALGDELHLTLPPGWGWYALQAGACGVDVASCDGASTVYVPTWDEPLLVGIRRTDGACGPYTVDFLEVVPE